MTTLLQKIKAHYHTHHIDENRVVLQGEHSHLTLAELARKVETLSKYLQQQNINTLALYANNCPEWVIVDLACQEANICFLPLPIFFTHKQLQHCLNEAGADALLSNMPHAQALVHGTVAIEPVTHFRLQRIDAAKVAQKPEGTRKITFTSGSTGAPKGVCLDNELQYQVAAALGDAIAVDNSHHLCLLPLSTLLENVGGVYRALLSGGTVTVVPEQTLGFSGTGFNLSKLLAGLERHQPNTLIVLPELLLALTQACEQGWQAPASLAFIAVGGAKVSPALINQAQACGLPVYEGYGLSECGSVVSLNTAEYEQVGSSGKALPHNRVVIEDNEIIVKGDVFLGYLNEPASWYPDAVATGDLASIDDAGYVHIHGRRKNLLISSFGRNINPEWIESEVLANPAIQQCVAFGDAQPFCSALIVPRSENTTDNAIQEWLDQCNQGLPEYAQVKAWLRIAEPMTSQQGLWTENGRPKRQAIAAHFNQAMDALYASSGTNVMHHAASA